MKEIGRILFSLYLWTVVSLITVFVSSLIVLSWPLTFLDRDRRLAHQLGIFLIKWRQEDRHARAGPRRAIAARPPRPVGLVLAETLTGEPDPQSLVIVSSPVS